MDLHEVMKAVENLGYIRIGKGPKHPDGDPEVQAEIDEFLALYPQVKQDQSFVDFFEYYSAIGTEWPNEALIFIVYGFSPDIMMEIAHPDEALVDENGFFRFAEIIFHPEPYGKEGIASVYAFDTTGQRRSGIYQETKEAGVYRRWPPKYEWYCETFLEWLTRVVEAQSPFTASRYKGLKRDMSELEYLILFEPEIDRMNVSSNANLLEIALPEYEHQSIHVRWIAENTFEISLTPKTNQDPDLATVSFDEAIAKIKEYLAYLKAQSGQQE